MDTQKKGLILIVIIVLVFAILIVVTVSRPRSNEKVDKSNASGTSGDTKTKNPWITKLTSLTSNIPPGVDKFPPQLVNGQSIDIPKTTAWLTKQRKLKLAAGPASPPFTVTYSVAPGADVPVDDLKKQVWTYNGNPNDKNNNSNTFVIASEGGKVVMTCSNVGRQCIAITQ